MSTSKFTEAWLKSKIRKIQTDIVDELALRIETGARRNFNKAVNDVSTDDPVVTVVRTKNGEGSHTITCSGRQVLFIEFGVGVDNAHIPTADGNDRPAFGFDGQTGHEVAQRPLGIDRLGYYHLTRYHRSKGLDPVWVRPSETGVPRMANESLVREQPSPKSGLYAIWTHGHPPVRALWRARNNAIKKLLQSGKMRRLG